MSVSRFLSPTPDHRGGSAVGDANRKATVVIYAVTTIIGLSVVSMALFNSGNSIPPDEGSYSKTSSIAPGTTPLSIFSTNTARWHSTTTTSDGVAQSEIKDQKLAPSTFARVRNPPGSEIYSSKRLLSVAPAVKNTYDPARELDFVLAVESDLSEIREVMREVLLSAEPGATERIHGILMNAEESVAIRVEAAMALGAHGGAAGERQLRQAFADIDEELLLDSILGGIAQSPTPQAREFMTSLIEGEDVDREVRAMALEALGEFTPESYGYLLEVAATDPDPVLRRAAIDASIFSAPEDTASAPLITLAFQEQDASVRAGIYAAIAANNEGSAAGADTAALNERVASEQDLRARLEGVRMLAAAVNAGNRTLTAEFDQSYAAWLKETAKTTNDRHLRSLALDALVLVDSAETLAALRDLSASQQKELSWAASEHLALVDR